ncbi:MAG: carboxypeptidase-like regulatory domain-containing protein [Acidobacteriia bacterium]|nr:carboxypeptidase-like regulatory domain-containing protein [Terriglobia bacterium]
MLYLLLAAQLATQSGTISAPAQQQQTPTAPGTATLRGHIFAADSGRPLRKAQVRIFAGEIRENRMATTDENGAYEFKDVRAGRYSVSASKGSYVSIAYGQQRPTDASKPLEILDNQIVERLDLSLPRGGVITGRIVDEYGEPAPEIQIAAQRYQFIQGQRRLVPSGRMATTNDIGEFRLFGIPPGQYYISATWRNPNMSPNANPSDRTAYAPTYFPGTTNANDAQRVTIAAGQQVDGVAMVLNPIKAARVSGTATGADGKPLTPAMIMVTQTNTGFGFSMTGTAQVRPDGTFTVVGLAPGDYSLRAQRMGGPSPDGPETAMANVTVAGEDVSDVHLVAAKPSRLTGRVIVDPAAVSALPPTLMLSLFPVNIVGIPAPPPPPARIADDFTFETKSTPGRMRIMLGGGFNAPPTGWAVRSVRVNGVDVTDAGIEFKPNEEISGVEVELTNKLTTISGLVTNSRGEASKDYTAIVFAQDKDKWAGNSRYQSMGRPDQDGRFKIMGLPPGEYYIIAVDRVEPGQQGDPDFLESVRSRATSLSLNEGETKTVDLRLNPVS